LRRRGICRFPGCGYINIATAGQKTWQRFCEAAGATALMERPEYKTAEARSKNRDAAVG
jgi:crotonobetainyl-CoA:carnitine CoA-transferase CaiB-like acyl-CoA transferase